jgi:predicted ArsR family transcriptional regulator
MPECDVCGESFDTERGVKVHASQVHSESDRKKQEVMIMEMISEGKKTVTDLADSLGMQPDKVKARLNELIEKDYIQENVESGKDKVYTLTERGQKEIPALVRDVLEETQDFVDGVRGSFEKHLGPLLPKIDIQWPKKRDEE